MRFKIRRSLYNKPRKFKVVKLSWGAVRGWRIIFHTGYLDILLGPEGRSMELYLSR